MGRSKVSQEKAAAEKALQDALAAVITSGLDSKGHPILSLRSAAQMYDVPKTTLTARFNGRHTRSEAHAGQQKLTPPQEEILKEWIKVLGKRGVPLDLSAVANRASIIAGGEVGVNWARRFRKRHPDMKANWTTALEACRAACLNRPLVTEYFEMLGDIIRENNIPPENIYNMDEKGIQMGIGKRTLVLVDRDQKTVNQVEDGNRELVTVIECVSADGSALHPSVIYKGKRRDLEWG
jgi:helix-turn-helix, Psq domain/Tc5 transposase DNA-binding domain